MQVEFSRQAENDLREIALYIGSDNPARAITFVLELQKVADAIGSFPERFQQIAERKGEAVRRRTHRNYLIFYRHNPKRVAILRIIHGAKVTDEFLEDLS